ncbi:putative Acetylgalactosaminyl-O-glycosyl-glycoprotein beta-1,3-N-acetylglucosaminyltransferase [Hypsibius exemplaris]|uniref:Hexosyltransferase n=1 Tax=Hypsibius exemplaris TaxID=2072580 RepID=A0A1W0XBS0_HYPEX|nr:putative Acetylgalactosaminyl-O-glycosyl-glycoprotein beta-1,3-N-acetylglucosaminyltransferase [Hypsibius exemplaris]
MSQDEMKPVEFDENTHPFEYIRLKLQAAYSLEGDGNFTHHHLAAAAAPDSAVELSPERPSAPAMDELNEKEDDSRRPLPPSMEFTYADLNVTFCQEAKKAAVFLLVIVHSAPAHFLNRQLIRQTWANSAWQEKQNFTVLFLMGRSVSEAVEAKMAEESKEFGDVLQYEDYLDSYRNLTYKNLAGLYFLSRKCPNKAFQFLLKTDDDMFLYLRPIVSYLRQEAYCSRFQPLTIMCAEFQRKEIVQRSKSSKWHVPWALFGEKHYPPYCYGGGYILTNNLVGLLAEAAKGVPYYWIDDVFVTGFTARQVPNVKHLQLPGQNPIKGFKCDPQCRKKNGRWFIHTLQRVDLLESYFRPLKKEGLIVDKVVSSCDITTPAGKGNKATSTSKFKQLPPRPVKSKTITG